MLKHLCVCLLLLTDSSTETCFTVEPTSASDAESLEVAKDCLSEVFKVDSSSTSTLPESDSLIQIFSSQTGKNEIKSDQSHEEPQANTSSTSCTNNAADTKIPATSQSLVFIQILISLYKSICK